jgi:hypothetical protein
MSDDPPKTHIALVDAASIQLKKYQILSNSPSQCKSDFTADYSLRVNFSNLDTSTSQTSSSKTCEVQPIFLIQSLYSALDFYSLFL